MYSKNDFISKNPSITLNTINANKLSTQANSLQNNYLPELNTALAYQKIDDPTSYGDNYSFNIAIHIPLNGGNFKEAEALQVNTLTQKSKSQKYKLQRENEFIQRNSTYKSALEQLNILEESLIDYKKSEKIVQTAFLKQYIDFNSYLQVLTQVLAIKEQIIELQNQVKMEATILNGIASGVIYE